MSFYRHRNNIILLIFGLGSLLLLACPSVAWAQEEQITHVVQDGETLMSIALQYDTTVEALAEANGIVDVNLISVGQKLVIPGATEESSAPVVSDYVVLPGDTLNAIARRFDATPQAVAQLNGVLNPVGLAAGQTLAVPGRDYGRLHRVVAGETALGLALRYDLPLWEFMAVNKLDSPGALLPGQRVWVPNTVSTNTLPLPFETLDVGPIPIVLGHTARVRVALAPGATVRGVFDDQALNFVAQEDVHYALFGVHALAEPGIFSLALLVTDAAGDEIYFSQTVEVLAGDYGYEEIILTEERDSLLDPVAIAAERERLSQIKALFSPERYWDGLFVRPIDTQLTSFFGTRRLYQSPSYESYGYHEGTDFDGEVGTPVYAPAAGVVALAEALFVRGNAVVIDHGWGIYTGYWHLSQIDVEVGQQVAPGDQIALVGHTGLSTGAHLHWDFWVNGTNVNALQWTEQPFP